MARTFAIFVAAAGALARFSGAAAAAHPSTAGTAPFILNGDRIYVHVAFVRPDGSLHRSLAYVDTGAPTMGVGQRLLKDLRTDATHPLRMRLGGFDLSVPVDRIDAETDPPRKLAGLTVDASLPASVLSKYDVIVDYARRRLTIAKAGVVKPLGIPTPFRLNAQTGLLAVDASINDKTYSVTIDLGSAWTWFRQSEVKSWLMANRGCERAVGAVGASNMMMVGDLEATGVLARIPQIRIGAVKLTDVDVLGPGPTKAFPVELFDWYSRKNAEPVLGWIGGNVLKQFRLTIDYPHRIIYWQRETPPDRDELNQIGLSLRREGVNYVVAGIATKGGRPTVDGVQLNDVLLAVDGRSIANASLGAVFQALHGRPGETRLLLVRRNNRTLTVAAKVTAF